MREKQTARDGLRSVAGFSIGLAVLMIVVGFVAIAMPAFAGLGYAVEAGLCIGFLSVWVSNRTSTKVTMMDTMQEAAMRSELSQFEQRRSV